MPSGSQSKEQPGVTKQMSEMELDSTRTIGGSSSADARLRDLASDSGTNAATAVGSAEGEWEVHLKDDPRQKLVHPCPRLLPCHPCIWYRA